MLQVSLSSWQIITGSFVVFILCTPLIAESGSIGNRYNCSVELSTVEKDVLSYYSMYLKGDDEAVFQGKGSDDSVDHHQSNVPVESFAGEKDQYVPTAFDSSMSAPWPMMCHDLRHTGRSPYSTVDTNGALRWRYETRWIEGGITIGQDNIIYFCDTWGTLYALYPTGDLKWEYKTGGPITSSPAIGGDKTVYVSSWDDHLYAIHHDGTLQWKVLLNGTLTSSPAIGRDGTIYLGTFDHYEHGGGFITAVNPDGTVKWTYETGYYISSSPAIGDDETIYIGSADTYLYAMNPDGTLKWRFKTDHRIKSPPSIAEDGTIYIGSHDGHVYALHPDDGGIVWKCPVEGTETNPSIGPDGTIYVGGLDVYAINPDGTMKWVYDIGSGHYIHKSSPAVSADGSIYIGTCTWMSGGDIIALNADGSLRWRFKIAEDWVQSSPCIGPDGTVYIGSSSTSTNSYGYLYAFGSGGMHPPYPPSIEGPTRGHFNEYHRYTFNSTDPQGFDIYYYIEWGEGYGITNWKGPYESGESLAYDRLYDIGTYTIRAKAKNEFGLESEWSTLQITMPIDRGIELFLHRFFNPHLDSFFPLFFARYRRGI